MKAVVFGHIRTVGVRDVAVASIEADSDAVVRVTCRAICGTDLHMYDGRIAASPGLVRGREPLGIVEQVGRAVETLTPACASWCRPTRTAAPALGVAVLWVLSPIDLIPEFLPVIGPLDDVVAVVLLLRYAPRSIPRPVLLAAWPAEPRLLERVLAGRRPPRSVDPASRPQ